MMTDADAHNSEHAELLISRIVDGEAGDAERAQFEELAAREPSLWRTLAMEQESAALLTRGFEREAHAAARVELPGDVTPAAAGVNARVLRGPWVAAGLGWAAVLVLAVVWMVTGVTSTTESQLTPVELPPIEELGYDQSLEQYLQAPWVRGQMQPVLLEIERLPDGTRRVWIMRRIEEYVDVPADAKVPVNERNELTEQPADLRSNDDRGGNVNEPKG